MKSEGTVTKISDVCSNVFSELYIITKLYFCLCLMADLMFSILKCLRLCTIADKVMLSFKGTWFQQP